MKRVDCSHERYAPRDTPARLAKPAPGRPDGNDSSTIEQFDDFSCCVGESQDSGSQREPIYGAGFAARYCRKEFNIAVIPPLTDGPYFGFLICAQSPIEERGIRHEIIDRLI